MTIFLRAPCKINLTLDVFDKKERTDGYHNLDSLVLLLGEPADEVRIYIVPTTDETSISVICNNPQLPTDNQNLAYRAAHAYLTHVGKAMRITIDLNKHVPAEAGLGGGSSNAAAVLRALNVYFNQLVDGPTLTMLAAGLGADVPLFLAEKPAVRMRGLGDIVEPLDFVLPTLWGVLVHPGTGVSTARAYSLLDALLDRPVGTGTEQLLSRLRERKNDSTIMNEILAQGLSNDFESVVLAVYPDVAKAYDRVVKAGALRALLCGSGSAVFGLARDMQHARQLVDALTREFSYAVVVSSASDEIFHIERL